MSSILLSTALALKWSSPRGSRLASMQIFACLRLGCASAARYLGLDRHGSGLRHQCINIYVVTLLCCQCHKSHVWLGLRLVGPTLCSPWVRVPCLGLRVTASISICLASAPGQLPWPRSRLASFPPFTASAWKNAWTTSLPGEGTTISHVRPSVCFHSYLLNPQLTFVYASYAVTS